MNKYDKLLELLNEELGELTELLSQEESIRSIVSDQVRLIDQEELSDEVLQDFAQDLEAAHAYLLETGVINSNHVRISVLMVAIATTIQITYLAKKNIH